MNYLQRLIKRAQARPIASQQILGDPFTPAESEEAVWPATDVTGRPPTGESSDNPAASLKPQSVAPEHQMNAIPGLVANQKNKQEDGSINHIEAPQTSSNPVKGQDNDLIADPEVLNKNPSIAIIDEIMEPFIQSVVSKLEPEVQSSVAQPKVVADAKPATTEAISSLRPQPVHSEIAKKKELEDLAPRRIQSLLPEPEAPVTPVKPAAKHAEAVTDSEQSAVAKKSTSDQKPSQKVIIERQNKVIVIGGSSQTASDMESTSSGSPHIGIGQL